MCFRCRKNYCYWNSWNAISWRIQDEKKRLRNRKENNPFKLSDLEFIRRYRLSKELTLDLCEELRLMLKEPVRSTDLDLETKVNL